MRVGRATNKATVEARHQRGTAAMAFERQVCRRLNLIIRCRKPINRLVAATSERYLTPSSQSSSYRYYFQSISQASTINTARFALHLQRRSCTLITMTGKRSRPSEKNLPLRRSKRNKSSADDESSLPQHDTEQLAAVVPEEWDSEGEDCELHVYEARADTRGEMVYLRVGKTFEFELERDKSHRASLVLIRNYDATRELTSTELQVRSQYVRKALRKVIGTYPGINLNTSGRITIPDPPMCLFHYRDELEAYAKSSADPTLESHMRLCLGYMKKALKRQILHYEATMQIGSADLGLEHQHLWMAYKPGTLLYEKVGGVEIISRLRYISAVKKADSNEVDYWVLAAAQINHNGQEFGYIRHTVNIHQYDGCRPIRRLRAFPLHLHPDEQRIRLDLAARGRKFLSLSGIHFLLYDGMATILGPSGGQFGKLHVNVISQTNYL
jgi:hypothetical protein